MSDVLTKLRSNQLVLNVVAGALGGGVGSVFAELVNALEPRYPNDVQAVVFTGLWCAFFTSVIAAALFAAGAWYQRRDLRPQPIVRALLFGALAGFIAGSIAQWLYQQDIGSLELSSARSCHAPFRISDSNAGPWQASPAEQSGGLAS